MGLGLLGCTATLVAEPGDARSGASPAWDAGPADAALDPLSPRDAGWVPDGDPPIEDAAPAEPEAPVFEPAGARLLRLTVAQYGHTVRDLLGDVALPADLEADTPLHGFAVIGGSELTISPRAAEQYEAAARDVAAQVFAREGGPAFTGCETPEPACLERFFADFGRRAWRRPLDAETVADLVGLAAGAGERLHDAWGGVEVAVAAMLQAPDFLFRAELAEPGPEGLTLDAWALASRLSYFLWQSAPDAALLDAAADGTLATPEGLRAEAERLLADPRAERGVLGFFAEAFTLERLAFLNKNRATFPQMSPTLGAAMRAEVMALLRWIVLDRDADLRELLVSRTVFVDAELAALYQLPAVEGADLVPYALPAAHPRGGLLGTAGFLALHAHATVTSPTLRGKAIQNHLLCFDVPPPPPGVATNLEPDAEGAPPTTTREKLARHAEDPTCNGCHQFMDPLGLSLENFDAIGAWRTTENGHPIDASGALRGEPFVGGRALAARLAEHPDFTACQVRRLYRYALGHLESRGEEAAIDELVAHFDAHGHRVLDLVLALVTHPSFRRVGEPL